MVSGSISLPLPGFFSPFPHGTVALSVAVEYLALDRGRPCFRQGFSCPAVLRYCTNKSIFISLTGISPSLSDFSKPFCYKYSFFTTCRLYARTALQHPYRVWTLPISLATTFRISFDFFSLSYLDGSLHSVMLCSPILFRLAMLVSLLTGYPIRLSTDQ